MLEIFKNSSEEYKKKKFIYQWGDVYENQKVPYILVKTRPVNNMEMILTRVEVERHWGPVQDVKQYDIKYENKFNIACWRGVTTGLPEKAGSRFALVDRWFGKTPMINCGFNEIVQNRNEWKNKMKSSMDIRTQLKYKFIISVEGNDCASGLKWQLYSNSVVMMCKPTICSWFMEDHLIPFTHYIPLKTDYSDLLAKCKWAIAHPQKCKEISRNAKAYVEQFLNTENELLIQEEVMKRYLDNHTIITDPTPT
jgi:hypothetical protein